MFKAGGAISGHRTVHRGGFWRLNGRQFVSEDDGICLQSMALLGEPASSGTLQPGNKDWRGALDLMHVSPMSVKYRKSAPCGLAQLQSFTVKLDFVQQCMHSISASSNSATG